MCHYITGFLAGSFDLKEARMLAERFSIVLDPIENRSVAKLLAPDEVYFNMTKGMCACGTDLCNQKNAAQWIESEFRRLDRDEKKHRKKGWSDAKIERWRSQQNEMIHRRFGDEPLEIHPGPDCIRFSEFFNTLFEETNISKVGFLLHFYSGGVSSDKIDLKGRTVFHRKQLLPETLFSVYEDTMNVFLR